MSRAASARRLRSIGAPESGPRLEGLTLTPGAAAPGPGSPHDEIVPRPRLVHRLAAARTPLALVAAPAGYGKTTLLGEWDRCDERPFAWVTIDAAHNESGAVAQAVELALDRAVPVEPRIRVAPTRTRRSSPPVTLARVARSLGHRPPFVLVIDDVHVLQAEDSLDAVRTIARHVPPGCVLALGSRTEPALPIGRLRANRSLTELRAHDLAMSGAEAAALLERSGLRLGPADVATLVGRAEGWPVGLYLAAVALRDEPDTQAAAERFGGDETIVAGYLRDEVLSQLPAETVSFLTRASILDRLSGSLCDFVLDRSGSGLMLDSIDRGGLLLVSLDRTGEAYRLHGLLAQMLRTELRRAEPGEEGRLHRRASDWYAEHADSDRALHHAVAASDTARVAALMWASAPACVSRARNGRVESWLSSFTPDQIAAQPALALAAANSHLLKGEFDAVQRWESAAVRTLTDTAPAERTRGLEASVAILQAAGASRGLQHMGEDSARGYELEREDSPWRPICCLLEGVALQVTGEFERARPRLEEGVRRATVAAPNIQALCLAQLALAAADTDDWDSAVGYSARALAQVARYSLGDYPSSALVYAVSAAVRARRGRVEEAQQDARHARRLLGMLTDYMPWYEVETRIALASAAVRLSDHSSARELLAEAARFVRRMPEATALHEGIARMEAQVEEASARPTLLTTAELRILAFLPTHLSFREIAGKLYVSANTVKTQAHAVYRKLDAASRSEAVAHATQLGLLDC
jgi:LuxR family maltose regulon positive regulatory protein